MLTDLKYAARQLLKAPGFSATTVLILALGIGGVTAMFSTLYSVMIRPLPYPDAERLVMGRATFHGIVNPMVSGPDYIDYREQSRSFSALEAFFCQTFELSARAGQTTEQVECLLISSGLFQTLGVNMVVGRAFIDDDSKANAEPVAIISHALWRRLYEAGPDLAGRTITIDGIARQLVGVAPPEFDFLYDADVWLPLTPQNLGPRRYNNWLLVGRLNDGVSLAQAQSEVDIITGRLAKTYPDTNANKALLLTPLQSAFAERYRSGFMLLCGGAAAVLLIACANAAGLLLARGAARHGELAVRAAMGASHWQIMRVLLAETTLLAMAAGVLGTLLALWIHSGVMHLFSVETLFLRDVGPSWPLLGFVLLITAITAAGFGLLPAWRAKRPDLVGALRAVGRGSSRQGTRLRDGLVAAQVGISFVLLVVAGLLTRSLASLHRENPGFDTRNLLTAEVPLPRTEFNDLQRTQFFTSLLENVRALPGVESAAAISQLPLRDPSNDVSIYEVGGQPADPRSSLSGYQRMVLPGYFETMRIPLLRGRDVRESDTRDSARVVVISQALADQLFADRDPLGRHVIIDRAEETPWEIVGIVGDIKTSYLRDNPSARGAFYRPHHQISLATMRLAIRTATDPRALVAPLRALLQRMDPRVPLSGPRTMEEVIGNASVSEKAEALCLAIFSVLALVLAAVGIYGVLAYRVAQQARDIGIRMALGANHRDVAWSILRQAALLAIIGATAGAIGAFGISHVIRSSLYGIAPHDPSVFLTSALALVTIAGLAAWLPARRATRVDPVLALRAE